MPAGYAFATFPLVNPITRSSSPMNVAAAAVMDCGSWTAAYGRLRGAGWAAATPPDRTIPITVAFRNFMATLYPRTGAAGVGVTPQRDADAALSCRHQPSVWRSPSSRSTVGV